MSATYTSYPSPVSNMGWPLPALPGELPKVITGTRNPTKKAAPPKSTVVNLSSVNLNLLVALEALLDECSVTQAANRIGLSQPAVSRALAHLRGLFKDKLLVRSSSGLVRTARGEELHVRLPSALGGVRELMSQRAFSAKEWHSAVHLGMADHQAMVLLPPLLSRLEQRATHLELVTEPLVPDTLKKLESGEISLAIGQVGAAPAGYFRRTLYTDRYVCLVRRGHPAIADGWTADRYFMSRHVAAAARRGGEGVQLYDELAAILPDRERTTTPTTLGAAMIAAESDMVLTVPLLAAIKMAKLLALEILTLPVELPSHEVALLWHERSHRSAEHVWLRSEIAAIQMTQDAISA